MKILLTIFVLFFSSSVVSDDISDFEIEGMSIGNSLLDYIQKENIKDIFKNAFYFNDREYMIGGTRYTDVYKLNTFEVLQITVKTDDNEYLIHSIEGKMTSFKNINECLKIRDEIVLEISDMFKQNARKSIQDKKNHDYDRTGNTKYWSVDFYFKTGGYIQIVCTDWSKDFEKTKQWKDELSVGIYSKEYQNYLQTVYN